MTKKFDPRPGTGRIRVRIPLQLRSAVPWEPPADWAARCSAIEKAGKVTLSPAARGVLWFVISKHATFAYMESALPKASDARKEIKRVTTTAGQMRRLLEALDRTGADVIKPLLRSKMKTPDVLDGLPAVLRQIEDAGGGLLAEFSRHVTGGMGSVRYPRLGTFVFLLALIFELSGGNPSAAYSTNYGHKGGRGTPFVRFCKSVVDSAGPRDAVRLPSTISGWGEAVRDVLHVLKTSPNIYLKDDNTDADARLIARMLGAHSRGATAT